MVAVSIQQVEEQLAQTQCTECGYNGCAPYAQAIVEESAAINLCRPGGERVVAKLADLLDQPIIAPAQQPEKPQVVNITAADCIGCTLCIQACPTDAIIGAPKQLHVVDADRCTGCKLCLKPCPVDCITLHLGESYRDMAARTLDIANWVKSRNTRLASQGKRFRAEAQQKATVNRKNVLPAELQARIEAARQRNQQKYAGKEIPAPQALRNQQNSGE